MTAPGAAAVTVAAEERPAGPQLGRTLRDAAVDFYYHSWRLAPANVLWTVSLVAILVLAGIWLPLLLLLPLVAIPGAGLARMATLIARGESVSFGDFGRGIRDAWGRALVVGVAAFVAGGILVTNVLIGLDLGGVLGWTFAVLAGYASIALAMLVVVLWPLLGDPARCDRSLPQLVRLAALVGLSRPGRVAGLTLLLAAFLLVSTVLFAALVTVSVAYAALVAARYVLPLADRLDAMRA